MTSSTSFENHQGNGSLKLKIKFCRSKGFVSDFVNDSVPDAHVQKQVGSVSSEPTARSELLTSSQHKHVSSDAGDKFSTVKRPTFAYQLSSNDTTASTDCLDLRLNPEVVNPKRPKDLDSDLKKVQPILHPRHSSVDVKNSFSHELNSQCQNYSYEDAEKHLCNDSKSKHADNHGVNYRKVLQDLEFLSAQQDEPDGRDTALLCGHKERHLTTARTEMNGQFHKLAMAEPGSMTEEVSRSDAQLMEEYSDGEPMSPFDINCSLGLADEDFTFSPSTQNPVQKQEKKKEIKENPLFPWSVDGSTTSFTHCAEYSSDNQKPVSSPGCQSQSQSDGKLTHASVVNNVKCISSDHLLKTNTTCRADEVQFCSVQSLDRGSTREDRRDERTDSTRKRLIIVDCQNRGGERLDSEINNNSHVSQFSDSSATVSNSSDYQARTIHLPQCAAVVPTDADQTCSAHPPSSVNAASLSRHSPHILSLLLHGNGNNKDLKWKPQSLDCGDKTYAGNTASDSEKPQTSVNRTHSSGPVSDRQYLQFSASDHISSSAASDMKQNSSSVTPRIPTDSNISLKTSVHSFDSSASQQLPGKERDRDYVKSNLLVKLLACKDKVPNAFHSARSPSKQTPSSSAFEDTMTQLAENPPLIEPLPVALTRTPQSCVAETTCPPGRPLMSTPPYQLNRTIDELRKRIGEKVLPAEMSGSSQESGPSAQLCSPKIGSFSSGSAESKQRFTANWCRCEEPDPFAMFLDRDPFSGKFVAKGEACRKCQKKLSRSWKRLKCKQKKQVVHVWCRCNSPDPYIPEGTVSEMCRKCLKRVSKKWRKRIASKWCKCHTPVLSSFRLPSNQGTNTYDQFHTCKRCQKLVSKEKEEVSMKGDLITPPPVEKKLPPMGPQPVMTDHNYSQSPFSPNAQTKMPIHRNASVMHQTAEREQSEEFHGDGNHSLTSYSGVVVQGALNKVVYVFPPTAGTRSGNSYIQSQESQKSAELCGHFEGNSGKSQLSSLEAQSRRVTQHGVTATSIPPGLVQTTYLETSSDSVHFTSASSSLTSGEHFGQENLCAPCTRSTDKTQSEATPVSLQTKRKACKQSTCPSWLQGVSQDLLQPCYVVMEKLQSESLWKYASGEHVHPCSVSCRQHSLNILCKLGELQQCGHSLEYKDTFDRCNGKRLSIWNRKRDYFRQNQTMVGYKEFRRKELKKRKEKSQQGVGDTEALNATSSPGFFPLTSVCAKGLTTFRISSQNGVRIQKMAGNCTVPQQYSDQLQGASVTDSAEDTPTPQTVPVVRSSEGAQQKVNGRKGNKSEFLQFSHMQSEKQKLKSVDREGNSSWSKKSEFNVKYYVFGSQNRAFIVPLIQSKRSAKRVQQLDEEDLGYVKAAIGQLLVEKDSCARHLKYPDSLQHKGSRRTASQCASKKAFVAPTLGDEDLDIEALKSLISDRDFSRLVPRNTRTSKSKYLQEIGERVHMYLTGGCEETPEWIKDVAKSIVLKHRNRGKNKKRLKPSKDISIEIDYAEEEELVDVGEEGILSPSHASVTDSDMCAAGSFRTLCETETASQSNNNLQCLVPEADPTSHPTGSYVVAEAFAQEEKKPLVQNVAETFSSASEVDGNIQIPGQQIMVPLPETCSYGQDTDEKLVSPPISSFSDGAQQQPVCELSVNKDQVDKKPVLGELLAATLLPLSINAEEGRDSGDHSQSEQVYEQDLGRTTRPSEQQLTSWPLPVVKEEPPDDDYSHAWPNQGQTEGVGPYAAQHSAQEFDTIPFISNSTFGKDAVEIEDEEGSVTSSLDQLSSVCSAADVQTVVKLEPFDADYSGGISVPLVTSVASEELTAVLAEPDHSETFGVEDNSGSLSSEVGGELSPCQVLPQIISVAYGEAVVHGCDVDAGDMITSVVEVSTCTDQTIIHCMPQKVSHPDEKDFGPEAQKDTETLGEVVPRSVENVCELLNTKDSGIVDSCEQKQVVNTSGSGDLPQISALTFGEAAKLWETAGDGSLPHSTEVFQSSDPGLTAFTCQPELVVYAAAQECVEKASPLDQQMENAGGYHTVSQEDCSEEYSEDLYDDDCYDEEENVESEQKPVVVGAGQLLAVPIAFLCESSHLEARDEQTSEMAHIQVGIDLSIVKQEPQEIDPSVSSVNVPFCLGSAHSISEYSSNMSHNHKPVDVNPAPEEPPFPSIHDVRSLAFMKLPSDRKEGQLHASSLTEGPQEAHNSIIWSSSSETALVESQAGGVHVAWENSLQSTTVASAAPFEPVQETEADGHQSPNAASSTAQNLKCLDSSMTKNDSSPSELDINVNYAASQVPQLEADAGVQQPANEKLFSQQELKRSCMESVPSKTKSKKRNRKSSRKRKHQQQMPVKSVVESSDSLTLINETENPSMSEKTISSAKGVELVSLESLPSSFSASQVSIPTTDVIEHQSKNVASDREIDSESQMTSSVTQSEAVVSKSDVMSSDRNSPSQIILNVDMPDPKIKTVPSTRGVLPAGNRDSADSDQMQSRNDTVPANQDTLPSASERIQPSNAMDITTNEDLWQASRTTPPREDEVSPREDGQIWIRMSQQNVPTPALNGSAPGDTNISPSDKGSPDLSSVLTDISTFHMPSADDTCKKQDTIGEVLSTGFINTYKNVLAAAKNVQKNSALPSMPENPEKSSDDTLTKSPKREVILRSSRFSSPVLSTDLQEHSNKNNLTVKLTDQVNPNHVVTGETALLETTDSKTCSEAPACVKTTDSVKGIPNTFSEKTSKGRKRDRLKSKGRKRARSKFGETSVSSTSVPRNTDLVPETTDSDTQSTVSTSDDTVISSASSPRGLSSERGISVLTPRITRSSKSSSMCLSESRVSSSYDVSVGSQKSDSLNSDYNGVNTLSLSQKSVMKNESEKKSEKFSRDGTSKNGIASSQQLVQSLQNSPERPQDGGTINASTVSMLDESAHYVSQISEGRGKQGRTCLVLRKKIPVQTSCLPPAPISVPSKYSAIDDLRRLDVPDDSQPEQWKDLPVPLKKLKEDTPCSTSVSKTGQYGVETPGNKGQKRKSDDLIHEKKSNKSHKAAKSERSIFSDLSTVLSSIPTSFRSTSTALPKTCPPQAATGGTNVLSEAAVKVAHKGFDKNLFSRLQVSFVSVKDNIVTTKNDAPGKKSSSAESTLLPQNARERSFFDCLPQGFVEAWKKT